MQIGLYADYLPPEDRSRGIGGWVTLSVDAESATIDFKISTEDGEKGVFAIKADELTYAIKVLLESPQHQQWPKELQEVSNDDD